MEQEQFEMMAIDYLREELTMAEQKEFEKALKTNTAHQKLFEELKASWNLMNELVVPETSEAMDATFFAHLQKEIDQGGVQKEGLLTRISRAVGFLLKPQLAYGIILLGIGLAVGYYFQSGNKVPIEDAVVSNQETTSVREELVLTLLEQPSAGKRLKAVSEVNKIDQVNEQVMAALLKTLNNDPNVNVRLAAIESLTAYANHPMVRQGLVQSIPNQESPIVQVTLANLMMALQEKKSIEPFRKLLKDKKLDNAVKKQIETTIKSII